MCDFERLPTHIVPFNYKICLRLDFEEHKFYGVTIIDLRISKTSKFLLLNSVDLSFNFACLEQNGNRKSLQNLNDFLNKFNATQGCCVSKFEYFHEKELALIGFNECLEPGKALVTINYKGCISDNMTGLYKAKYNNLSGDERYTFITQFEATDARKCFPCFDEPSFKATFDITIITEDNKVVLANMPLKEQRCDERETDLIQFIFQKTPVMSTYLVAFVIGEYSVVRNEIKKKGELDIRVYTPLKQEYLGIFSYDIARKSIEYFENFFSIKYPLPKLDLIAVPENPIEAMENWGLIIFNQPNLMLDANNSTYFGKLTVSYVVAHEIAHQWFGNLVTMDWWTDLWLNEGFATYMGYSCTNVCLPELDFWSNFISTRMKEAFYLDYLSTSHPIEIPIRSPSEINEIFDAVTYSKGASVIRMLMNYIGEAAFMKGIHNYLMHFKYSNAKTQDLWRFLCEASHLPIDELMINWTQISGYPVVSVERSSDEIDMLIFKQNRLFAHGIDSTDRTTWSIPITIKTASSYPRVKYQFLMEKECEFFKIDDLIEDEWILVNGDFCGFFITRYSEKLFNKLKLSLDSLNSNDRIGLQNEAFVLASTGLLTVDHLLDFVGYYKNENNGNVWSALIENLFELSSILVQTSYFDRYKAVLHNLCEPVANRLNWQKRENESDLDVLMRETVLYAVCTLGNLEHRKKAQDLFESMQKGTQIDINLKKPIFTTIISGTKHLRQIFDTCLNCNVPEEKMLILMMLREVTTISQIEEVCEFALNEATFEDAVILLGLLARPAFGTSYSAKIVWKFIKTNWEIVKKRYSKSVLLGRLLKPIIENLSSEEDFKDVGDFFVLNEASDAQTSIKQGLDKIQQRIRLLKNL